MVGSWCYNVIIRVQKRYCVCANVRNENNDAADRSKKKKKEPFRVSRALSSSRRTDIFSLHFSSKCRASKPIEILTDTTSYYFYFK